MKHLSGFTFIEILIVVAIIALFSGLSLAYYNSYAEDVNLETEARKIIDVLELAKKRASSADVSATCIGDFWGYKVIFDSTTQYKFALACSGGDSTIAGYEISDSENVVIFSAPPSILFKPLARGTDSVSDVTIVVKNPSITKCINITISPSGLINKGNAYTSGC